MTATDANGARELTALEMAANCARHVLAFADAADTDEGRLTAYVNRHGDRQHHAAEMAACMALVSLAEDVHRIADALMNGRLGGPPI